MPEVKKERCSVATLVEIYNRLMGGRDFTTGDGEFIPLEVFNAFLVLKAMKSLNVGSGTVLPGRMGEKGNHNLLRDAYNWVENKVLPKQLTSVSFASPTGKFTGRMFFDVKTNAVFTFGAHQPIIFSSISNCPTCLYLQTPASAALFSTSTYSRHRREKLSDGQSGEKVRIIFPRPLQKVSAPQIVSHCRHGGNSFDIRPYRAKIVAIAEALKTLFSNLT